MNKSYDNKSGFSMVFRDLLHSDAYKNLPTSAQALIPHLGLLYQVKKPDVTLSRDDAGLLLGVGKKAVKSAFDALMANGFIELTKGHCYRQNGVGRARSFRLTWMPYKGRKSTNEWMNIPLVGLNRGVDKETFVRKKRAKSDTKKAEVAMDSRFSTGAKKATTYIVTRKGETEEQSRNTPTTPNGSNLRQQTYDHTEVFNMKETEYLKLILANGQVEIRCWNQDKQTITGLYDSIDAMRDAVTGLKGDYNFYYTINPVKNGKSLINTPLHSAGKGSTTSDADIDYRSSVFFDFDLQRKDKQHPDCPDVAAGEPTPDEYLPEIYKEAMSLRDYLDAEGWSKPSIAFSGNGYHLVYHTKLSLTDSEKYLPALYTRLNAAHSKDNVNFDTSVKNLSRIGRLYGTVNQKGGRRSKVLSVGDWMDGETMITSIKKIAQAQLLKKKPVAWVSTPATNHLNKWVDGTEILNSFRQLGLYLKEVESGKHWVTCPNAHAHSSTGDTDTVLWVGARSSFHCSHDHCEQINITNVKEYL